MMKKTIGILTFALLAFVSGLAFADTSVWVVKSGKRSVYLGGTLHVLRAWDFPLPSEFDKAYQKASTIVFETEIGKLRNAQTQQMRRSAFTYHDGRTLEQVLSRKAYMTLMGYSEKIGVPIASLHPFKPPFAVAALNSVELQRNGMTEDGVDLHFYNKALADGKATRGLASVEEHLKYLAEEADGDEDDYVIHAIQDFKRMTMMLSQLVTAWRSGDEQGIERISINEMKRKYPKLFEKIVVERNQKWLPIIEAYFKTSATEFVLVGAAHLPGEYGLLRLLADRGYTISRLR